MLCEPCRKLLLVHYIDSGAVLISKLCGVISVAQQASIIRHHKSGKQIQKVLFVQVVEVPHPLWREGPVVHLCKADHAIPVMGHRVLFGVLLQSKVKRVQKELVALSLPALWQECRQRNRQHTILAGNGDPVHHAGRLEIIAFPDGSAGINQVPQAAGDSFCPQCSISGQRFIVVRVALYIGGVHGIQRIAQSGYIIKDISDTVGY